jgi:hypothetical protein
MIERDRLIMCQIKTGTDTSTTQIPAKYRVIGVYEKVLQQVVHGKGE